MGLQPRYHAHESARHWQQIWENEHTYTFTPDDPRPIFAIDTPPPTVSGDLHIGHVCSYTQAEAMVRFQRLRGHNVYYPFGFDDNGLPTERYVEKRLGKRATDMERPAFIAACLEISHEAEDRFEALWRSLGFSADWSLRYSTISPQARRVSQWSFLDLHRRAHIYRAQSPNLWCVECRTAIAQAEVDSAERTSTMHTLAFGTSIGATLPIATTRPELLPACVAVFVHSLDGRYSHLIGATATTPLFGADVPILADAAVDSSKGTGAVMCCTFGDTADVTWWRTHNLPLIALLERNGRLGAAGGAYEGLTQAQARARILADIEAAGALLGQQETAQTVRVHERCGTPLEILDTPQWFVRLLDQKDALIEAGRQITWRPETMHARYEHWVANLAWDWCISRQRFYGVPFPAWHCPQCGATILADEAQLPVDPQYDQPPRPCGCGNADLLPDTDVMDTWATSSCSPMIAGQMLERPDLFERVFPMQLRPQAHDIIRTWAFYTIAKAHLHFGTLPWDTVMVSGHALDPRGQSIHKSLGNSPISPHTLIERHGPDAVRYWACGATLGGDQVLDEEEMRAGNRLVTKLWNAARLIGGHLGGDEQADLAALDPALLAPADRALLSWLNGTIERVTTHFAAYRYAAARNEIEAFFRTTLCDNYLEWAKGRLYDGSAAEQIAARHTLAATLRTVLTLFAPLLPHVTEAIYQELFAQPGPFRSLHQGAWPEPQPHLHNAEAERAGEALLALATYVRRAKSQRGVGLGTVLPQLQIATGDAALLHTLKASAHDIRSFSRAQALEIGATHAPDAEQAADGLWAMIRW